MVSALDLGCSNHNPTQATTGNLIATFCQFHFGQKVGYFKKLFKDSTFSVTGLLWEVAIGLPEVAWVGLWLEQPRSSAETIKSQNLWLESSKNSSYVLIFRKYAIWNDELDELFNLSSHRFWLFMVSLLDLSCPKHNPIQATTGNMIATLCWCHFGQNVGYFQIFLKIQIFL